MSSCGTQEPTTPSKDALPEIIVNGVGIEEKALANELQYHEGNQFEQVVQKAGQALVIRQLLIDQANKKGFDANGDNEENAVQQLLAQEVSYDDPSEDTCVRYFEQNREKFATMPLMEVDHILLAAAKDDHEGRDAAKNNAKVIISQLKQEEKNGEVSTFAALAKEYSACPSKETGGSLGQISKGQTVPEFERQLMNMPVGLADKPLESRYGFHVVNISRKIEGKPLDYDMVRDKVRGYLIHRASHLAIQAYIQSLVEQAEITGIEVKFNDENVYI
jgi:peptidyl-prolyl cis-trans isomerase C